MVADVYDAVTSMRPYRTAMLWDAVELLFNSEVDEGKMDAEVVATFIRLVKEGDIPCPPVASSGGRAPLAAVD